MRSPAGGRSCRPSFRHTALRAVWPTSIPELVTPRLPLRAPLQSDAPALLASLADPEVTNYLNVPTFTARAEAEVAVERLAERFVARDDAIRWAIELVERGEVIGTVGLLRFDFAHRHAEIGYEIGRRWWGLPQLPVVQPS